MTDYAEFRDSFKPLMQADGMIPRIRRSLHIDKVYCDRFRHVRGVLRPEINRWPEAMVLQINKNRDLTEVLSMEVMDQFRTMFEAHNDAILGSRFDEDYFDTVEDLTLFFIHLDLRAVWMVGALTAVMSQSLENVYDRKEGGRRSAMLALFDFFALELSQVQRVYVRYAEVRFDRDYDSSGRLTMSS